MIPAACAGLVVSRVFTGCQPQTGELFTPNPGPCQHHSSQTSSRTGWDTLVSLPAVNKAWAHTVSLNFMVLLFVSLSYMLFSSNLWWVSLQRSEEETHLVRLLWEGPLLSAAWWHTLFRIIQMPLLQHNRRNFYLLLGTAYFQYRHPKKYPGLFCSLHPDLNKEKQLNPNMLQGSYLRIWVLFVYCVQWDEIGWKSQPSAEVAFSKSDEGSQQGGKGRLCGGPAAFTSVYLWVATLLPQCWYNMSI